MEQGPPTDGACHNTDLPDTEVGSPQAPPRRNEDNEGSSIASGTLLQ